MSKNQPSQIATVTGTYQGARAARPLAETIVSANPARRSLRMAAGTDAALQSFAAEVRLIGNWLDVIRRCARLTAHGLAAEDPTTAEELLDVLVAAESAIATRIAGGAELVDALAGWEASLLHIDLGVRPRDCLTCNRAEEIPEDLPAEYAWGLRVIEHAA